MPQNVLLHTSATEAAAALIPENTPIVMLNLLRYRTQADYGDRLGIAACSGREAFTGRYAAAFAQIAGEGNSQIIWLGAVVASLIGSANETWDDIALVEYPSFAAFRRIVEDPRYKTEAEFHREAALLDSRLIAAVKTL